MTNSTNKPTTGFWVISVIALIWNLIGVMNYVGQAYMTDEMLASLPEAQQDLYQNIPAWVTAAFAIAVFGGTLGSLLLLLKKKLASIIFSISILAIIIQMAWVLFVSKTLEVNGAMGALLPVLVIIIGAFLVSYSKKATANGWLS